MGQLSWLSVQPFCPWLCCAVPPLLPWWELCLLCTPLQHLHLTRNPAGLGWKLWPWPLRVGIGASSGVSQEGTRIGFEQQFYLFFLAWKPTRACLTSRNGFRPELKKSQQHLLAAMLKPKYKILRRYCCFLLLCETELNCWFSYTIVPFFFLPAFCLVSDDARKEVQPTQVLTLTIWFTVLLWGSLCFH